MRSSSLALLLLGGLVSAGCQVSKSSNPLSPTVAGPIAGVDISAPQPVSPGANAQIAMDQQPITLTVKNASTSGVRPLSYEFQLAADQAFGSPLFAKSSITPGDNGQTSVVVSDKLGSTGTYYWRARALDGANTGSWTSATAFAIFIPVVIQPPTPIQPINGATANSTSPTFIIGNAARTGPAGTMHYTLQVARDQAFSQIAWSGTFGEQANQTSMPLPTALPAATPFFWRAQAADGTNEGPWSATQSFVTPSNPAPAPPPTTPPPAPGPNAAQDQINMGAATIYDSPNDLASFTISTGITSVQFHGDGISVEFSKKDGGGRWPDYVPPGWDGPLEYTLGMCLNIGGHWDCSAVVQVWNGLNIAGGPPGQIGRNWFYDSGRWGPMAGHQPVAGETIGIFVCEGNCRGQHDSSQSPLRERSNVVLVQFPGGF